MFKAQVHMVLKRVGGTKRKRLVKYVTVLLSAKSRTPGCLMPVWAPSSDSEEQMVDLNGNLPISRTANNKDNAFVFSTLREDVYSQVWEGNSNAL